MSTGQCKSCLQERCGQFGTWPSVFVRWVLELHRSRCLSSNHQLVPLLGHWRIVVLNRLALLCQVWHAALMCVLDYGDLPTLIFMRTRDTYQCPRLIPRLPGRPETDMEYTVGVEIAWSMKRWRPRKARYLQPRWVNESASISYWRDGTVKNITSTFRDDINAFRKDVTCHQNRFTMFRLHALMQRVASEPVISAPRAQWIGGSQDWIG